MQHSPHCAMIYELAQIVKSVHTKKKLLQLLTFIVMFHVLFSSSQPLRGICHFVEESGSLYDS